MTEKFPNARILEICKTLPDNLYLIVSGTASVYRSVGGGLGDDYEIVIPPHMLANITWTNLGPKYNIDKPVELEILGPR